MLHRPRLIGISPGYPELSTLSSLRPRTTDPRGHYQNDSLSTLPIQFLKPTRPPYRARGISAYMQLNIYRSTTLVQRWIVHIYPPLPRNGITCLSGNACSSTIHEPIPTSYTNTYILYHRSAQAHRFLPDRNLRGQLLQITHLVNNHSPSTKTILHLKKQKYHPTGVVKVINRLYRIGLGNTRLSYINRRPQKIQKSSSCDRTNT